MEKLLHKAIVIGASHINTLGTVRSLGEMNVPVYAIITGERGGFIEYSKYLKKSWSILASEDQVLDVLLNKFDKNSEIKTVVFTTSDFATRVIDENIDKLKDYYILPNVEMQPGRVTYLMDKYNMQREAANAGLMVPKTMIVDLGREADTILLEDISYPCIAKPLNSIEGRKIDIKRIDNKNQMSDYLSGLKSRYNRILVQDYICGADSKMLEIIGFVGFKGTIYLPGILKKIRHYPSEDSSGSFFVVSENKFNIDFSKVHHFLEKIKYKGLFDLEFKFANGESTFIEINFRNGGTNYLYTVAGANIPYLWYLEACGFAIDTQLEDAKLNYSCMYEERDWRNVFYGKVSVFKWLKDFWNTNAFTDFNRRDMLPFFIQAKNIIKRIFSFRKKEMIK